MAKNSIAIGIIVCLCICVVVGFLVFNSEIENRYSSSLIVRTVPGSITRSLTGRDLIGIKNLNGVAISQFRDLQNLLGKIEKSKSVNIDYYSFQTPTEIISIATPSADPTSTNDYYTTIDLGIFPSESLIFCLKKGSIFAEMNLDVNDVIILFNNRPFNDLMNSGVSTIPPFDKVQVSLLRKGQIINLEKTFPKKMMIESIKDFGYLSPSPKFILEAFPWMSFEGGSIFMKLKGYSCGVMQ